MGDTKRMQVVNGCCHLMGDCAGALLCDNELAFVQVREEVAAVEHFHHDVDRILILEHIEELYYIGMLADFEDLDLTFEEL